MSWANKLILVVVLGLFLATDVYALQEVAGPVIINVSPGSTNSSKWGLMNDGNNTITVSLRAEGDASSYLSFPATVDLPSGKLVYTDITATLPNGFASSGSISGSLYALQTGKPGQVQINIQMKKSVTINVLQPVPSALVTATPASGQQSSNGQPSPSVSIGGTNSSATTNASASGSNSSNQGSGQQPNAPPQAVQPQPTVNSATVPITGFAALTPGIYYGIVAAMICIIGIFLFVKIKRNKRVSI